ncbi:MAG: hypothetical protein DIU73_000005 [Actinomycetes bacterium]|nr:MAG: hypothetical protein DIU73_04405 [Actinomycetota bacterium]
MGLRDLFGLAKGDLTTTLMKEAEAARDAGASRVSRMKAWNAIAGTATDWRSQVVAEVQAGRKLDAIKIYRENTGTSLAAAKEAVDRLEAGLP